ncbi:NAD(P)H-hydrate epimerase / ADP-dependent (S)-NAD(P)H-hydrate dehydratase, partial [hydrothermal vent metagenome]
MNTFYSANSSQQIDKYAIEHLNIPGILLMKQAGLFAFQILQQTLSPQHITILCGTGNNGGDGFIVAQLAAMSGINVEVCLFGDPQNIHGDALIAYQEMQAIGLSITPFSPHILQQTDVIIDAIFGTGLDRPITGTLRQTIEQVNQHAKPTLSLDIPSGLHADTGTILGTAIQATHTCVFITQKLGLYTHQGADVSGQVHYSTLFLDRPEQQTAFQSHPPLAHNHSLSHWLKKRPAPRPSQHKGQAGTVCLIGGNHNMMGAIQLAASASLHTGAGLVKVIT